MQFKNARTCSPSGVLILGLYFLVNSHNVIASTGASTLCFSYATPPAPFTRNGADWNQATQSLVAFYSALLAAGLLNEVDLLKMRNELVRGELVNPFPRIGSAATENDLLAKEVARLFARQVNTVHVLLWVESEMRVRGKERARRVEQKENTQLPFRKIEFARVQPGSFFMGELDSQVATTLSHTYFAMTTQVTQWMWAREFGENPAKFKVGDQAVEIEIYGNRIQLQPDHPVENITWWSWLDFANRLSKRYGLQPAYDLSKVKFDPNTSAAKGTYKPLLDGQTITNEMLVNHPSHNIYKTEGMRLPTEAEWEFLVRDRGRSNTSWHSGNKETDLKKVAWYLENADSKTHPVALLEPLLVDGKPFYDLHGNVWEWNWDWYEKTLKGGTDPVGPSSGSDRVHRGGSRGFDAPRCRSTHRYYCGPEYLGDGYIGARLVTSGAVILK